MERCLAAIVDSDVVGYSRLIRSDEDGTLAALKSLLTDLIGPKNRGTPWARRQAHG